MISYKQLLKGSGKTRKNLWYIRGRDPALVTDAIQLAKDHVYGGVSSVCLGAFFGSNQSDDLDSFVLRPYYEERKLIIVYDVETFTDITKHVHLSDPSTFFILVENGDNIVSEALHKFLTGNSKVRAVDCTLKSEGDLELLVNSRLNISDDARSHLIGQSNGDSEWLLNKVSILERFDVDEITHKLARLVCTDEGIPKFEKSLVEFDKQRCFLYIKSMGTEDIRVGRLINDSQNLALLNTVAVKHGKQRRAISDETGFTQNQIEEYIKFASYYDASSIRRILNLMMKLYEKLIRGDRLAYTALVIGW